MFANMQYLATVLLYTRGEEFTEAVCNNGAFILNALFMFLLSLYIIVQDAENDFSAWLGVVNISEDVRYTIYIGFCINFAVTFGYEVLIKLIKRDVVPRLFHNN